MKQWLIGILFLSITSCFSIKSSRCIDEINNDLWICYQQLRKNNIDEEVSIKIAQLLCEEEAYAAALIWYERALKERPNDQALLFSYASALLGAGKPFESIKTFEKVNAPSALYNSAYIMKLMGHEYPEMLHQAIALFKKLIEQNPNNDSAQLALGFAYLAQGDFERGWRQHELYLKGAGKNGDNLRDLLKTNQLSGKTVLLTYEGGFGDSINFGRYAYNLFIRGAKVKLFIQKPLEKLFKCCFYIDEIITNKTMLGSYDASAPLMSLPAIFWGQNDAIPNDIPYIFPPHHLIEQWGTYAKQYPGLKIGVCWQSDLLNDSSRQPIARRGIPLKLLIPLMQKYKQISFFSLQKKDGIEQLLQNDCLITFDKEFDELNGSFMDSAAFMMHCDLIITIDSAIAHLAGALGRPVWLLLPYATDWRWICGRKDSLWYPTMRIFKQQKPFDWNSVIMQLDQELSIIIR